MTRFVFAAMLAAPLLTPVCSPPALDCDPEADFTKMQNWCAYNCLALSGDRGEIRIDEKPPFDEECLGHEDYHCECLPPLVDDTGDTGL